MKFRLIGPLDKIHNIIIYIRGSTARITKFLELVKRKILLNNRIRWNSWYLILIITLEKRAAINEYIQNHESDLEEDKLTLQD